MRSNAIKIYHACTALDFVAARSLFQEYANWLNIDLSFQGFADELTNLPGPYVPPHGRLFLASFNNVTAGCVALRPLEKSVCEMKRLYVRPAFRHRGLGKMLAERIVTEAKLIGYSCMRLDTLSSMLPAIRLYEALGFSCIPAYYKTPLPDTIFMECQW